MSTTPPSGPKGPQHPPQPTGPEPKGPSGPSPKMPGGEKMLSSPFAQMFEKTGKMPTAKEMTAIINGILMQTIDEIKKSDERWKKAMKKLKKQMEGDE